MTSPYEELLDVAAECKDALRAQIGNLAKLEVLLDGLGQTCTGWEWWRDRDVAGKMPKLYIMHSVSQSCPLCGKPKKGKRLRVYIGSNGRRIREAQEAIAREEERQRLETRARRIRAELAEAKRSLRTICRSMNSL